MNATNAVHMGAVAPPKGFLQPCLLLLLGESPTHGYELIERLAEFGFERDPGGLYRALRQLESEGLVCSRWELSDHGPGRRPYQLTEAGAERLTDLVAEVANARHLLDLYVARHLALMIGAGPVVAPADSPLATVSPAFDGVVT